MLTTQQAATLAADIAADPAFVGLPQNSDGAFAIAAAYNQLASPAFIVWKTSVSQDEIMQNGFDWVQVDNLSVGKSRIWEWLFANSERAINPSKPNVRAGIAECWKGTAALLAVQAVVLGHCKRSATRIEKLLASGAGTDATPATMTFSGDVSYSDVQQAMGW